MTTHCNTSTSGVRATHMVSGPISEDIQVPWGWRFCPKECELIGFLSEKVRRQMQDRSLFKSDVVQGISGLANADVLREIDLSQVEPWGIKDIPETCPIRAAHSDELNQYFYTQKEQKYRHGKRSNRATRKGFWKATGRDKPIYGKLTPGDLFKKLIGFRKALVFYKGRAPNGDKTDWILHEYRLHQDSPDEQWVACHMFMKERNLSVKSLGPEVPQDWSQLQPFTVKEETVLPQLWKDCIMTQCSEPFDDLPDCVKEDLIIPLLEEDDKRYSLCGHQEVLAEPLAPCQPETETFTSDDGVPAAQLIADLLCTQSESSLISLWEVDRSLVSPNLWYPPSILLKEDGFRGPSSGDDTFR